MAVTEYTWNPLTDSVIEETDGAGNVLVEYTNEPAPYGPLISERRGSESRQYHFDALGSTRALTDDSQTVVDTFAYDAWGRRHEHTTDAPTAYLWCGTWGYVSATTNIGTCIRHRDYNGALGRWMTTDPLEVPAVTNQYHYAINNPVRVTDPSGLQCVVCGEAWHSYHDKIDTLDTFYVGTPFRDAADGHTGGVNATLGVFGVTYPASLPGSGLHTVRLINRNNAALHFLFFVVFDICESSSPPGDCRLFLDETGSQVRFVGADGGIRLKAGRNEGDVTDNNYIGTLFVPNGACKKSMIFTDLPGAGFTLGAESISVKLRQKIEVRDSGSGQVMASTTTKLDFSVDKVPVFTPRPDYIWTVRPTRGAP